MFRAEGCPPAWRGPGTPKRGSGSTLLADTPHPDSTPPGGKCPADPDSVTTDAPVPQQGHWSLAPAPRTGKASRVLARHTFLPDRGSGNRGIGNGLLRTERLRCSRYQPRAPKTPEPLIPPGGLYPGATSPGRRMGRIDGRSSRARQDLQAGSGPLARHSHGAAAVQHVVEQLAGGPGSPPLLERRNRR